MAESLIHCVACNRQLDDSRERRVLLDRRTRHVLPYLNELARSLDCQYDEFTRYSDMQLESGQRPSIKPYICRTCFLECEKGLRHEEKAQKCRATLTTHLSSRVPKRPLSCLSDYSCSDTDEDIGTSPKLPRTDCTRVHPSAKRALFLPQTENSSPAVTVSIN